MKSNQDYKKEWFSKAKIDYFSPFINLWLCFNSWYNFHYSLKNDREHIEKLKQDNSSSNKIFNQFKNMYTTSSDKSVKSFLQNLEFLHIYLNGANLKNAYNQKEYMINFDLVFVKDAKDRKGKIKKNIKWLDKSSNQNQTLTIEDVIDLGSNTIFLSDARKIFNILIENIYCIRCLLVHGELSPTDENHEIVKYCYFILYDLLESFCK